LEIIAYANTMEYYTKNDLGDEHGELISQEYFLSRSAINIVFLFNGDVHL